MSKYIDADKLRSVLQNTINSMKEKDAKGERYDAFLNGKLSICEELLGCIDSLQQEPRFPQYDNIVEKVFGAGNLEGWERDEAEILVALAKEELLKSLQQEQPEVDLEKFTEKIKTFQGRYKHPEIVSIKGAMAFMARMFYQYPNVARQWYEQLPKATMD